MDRYDRVFTRMEDLEKITNDFYEDLYAYKNISEDALAKVMKWFRPPLPML